MKKVTSIAAIVLLAVSFTACKKDWTCTCTNADGQETAKYEFKNLSKKDAKTGCDTWNTAASVSGGKCDLN